MNRLFGKFARKLWRISAPVSQPVIRKFDHHMMQLFGTVSLRSDAPGNLDLALSSVVRELARLQVQVEILQQQIEDLHSSEGDRARLESRLSVIGEVG
jgi:hypothetical protein